MNEPQARKPYERDPCGFEPSEPYEHDPCGFEPHEPCEHDSHGFEPHEPCGRDPHGCEPYEQKPHEREHEPRERKREPMLVLLGPTAVGKTALSLRIAEMFDCEIISGDSMQVYRGMDIGTAKATPEERARVPHHLIDIRDPDEPFSVTDFQRLCREAAADIRARGKLPFLVGGTGLYIEAACYDFQFTEAPGDPAFRERMKALAAAEGPEALHARLRAVDPASADRLHPNDVRRVIRALEIYEQTGVRLSEHLRRQRKQPHYDLCIIGLTTDRQALYERIDRRVDAMLAAGLVDEVRRLLDRGYDRGLTSMQGLGYKEIAAYLHGECTLEEAVEALKRGTRRFAKRQLSWFRHMPDIRWMEADPEKISGNLPTIRSIIAGKFGLDGEYT
jgi:tRNA dimethylallyltransferase